MGVMRSLLRVSVSRCNSLTPAPLKLPPAGACRLGHRGSRASHPSGRASDREAPNARAWLPGVGGEEAEARVSHKCPT